MFENPDKGEKDEVLTAEQLLAALIGEDKKYNTAEDASNAIMPAQEHITKLEAELATLKEASATGKSQNDMLDEMKAALAGIKEIAPQKAESTSPEKVEDVKPPKADQLGSADINELIVKQMQLASANTTRDKNIDSVTTQAVKAWGTDAQIKFYAAAARNGYTEEMIKDLSAQSPQAALHAVGLLKDDSLSFNNPAGTLRTNSPEFQKMDEPKAPANWGNDSEVADYMTKLQEYENNKEK